MTQITTHQLNTLRTTKMTTALRDGLITLAGIVTTTGSLLNQEITMWWLGA